tara:strand:- start:1211 stop:2287 length:1077 start_codon:yes stop_codon:yes gene_type:complete
MAFYKNFEDGDVIFDNATVTSGIFQDGASSIATFHSSSTQYTNTGDYNVDTYRYDPSNNASASVQFGVTYGHKDGSGSLGTKGAAGDRTTAAIFGQFNNMINPAQTTSMTFGSITSEHFYAIVFNRARMRERLEAGGWELHLGSGSFGAGTSTGHVIKLIDDSTTSGGTGNTRSALASPEYSVVSGSIAGGVHTAASDMGSTTGSYGSFYPKLGIILLNPAAISGLEVNPVGSVGSSILGTPTVTGSNTDNRNALTFFKSIKSGSYFQTKREEDVTSRHYFVRAKANEFNGTSNDTYYETTAAGTKRVIAGLASDNKTYITSVGLYNSESELLAVAKLSQPILKSKSREALIKVKLDF